ncbi:ATP-binding protein [Tuwongella immobilis]|uniref:Uncharacterized protein n=1 Tax=Tuwongella immobilis TaxID=692036 RepID=A0A6C2YPH2_9BACT|nr:ATP-binding protein [Tuwongella immobilis]VIP03089.1 Uncharacterized protein OS=Isosphaera pallida (strain ATCC 43644 / DSM 9630 / IS1B) GN=Isop_2440 PE=4 SV=1: AAA_24 [Tuwongella immobilis]VTS03354.1 Uncharacterized protein OS=Isosphaera pallida (strain ATCC 43644 / DSM 9630 / IS1B) GN=Isop_2440 PE=4 SV=1: AAA_24 [Tuwongella immobilis]
MGFLNRVQHGRVSNPPRLLIYGTPGIGKSTFGSQAPNPIFLPTEDGLDVIDCAKFPLMTNYSEVREALVELYREKHDFETLVVDSLDWLERLVWAKTCEKFGVKNIEKVDGGWGKGYILALDLWNETIDLLSQLRLDRGMAIILIAHAKVEKFEDPEAAMSYDRYSPRLHKHASAMFIEWCDAILFATRKFRTQSEDTGFGRKRTTAHAVGKAGGERILRPVGGPACIAKNRYGINDDLPLSWADWMAAMNDNALTSKGE